MVNFSLDIRSDAAVAAIRTTRPAHVTIASDVCEWEGSTYYNVIYNDDIQHRLHTLEDVAFVYGYTRGQGIGCTLMID